MKIFLFGFLLFLGGSVNAQNVLISDKNQPNEATVVLDPHNLNLLYAATNINNYYISKDTGRTWVENTLSSSHGVWGDPVMEVDTLGNLYFFHLSNPPSGNWIDRIVCQKSEDSGSNWNDGSYTGLDGNKDQDKHMVVLDRKTNKLYLAWTQFDKYGSSNAEDSSVILFSRSDDLGETWTVPIKISAFAGNCIDDDSAVGGSAIAIGSNGEVYVAWEGPKGLVFNTSTDDGESWMNEEIVVSTLATGWNISVPGVNRCNGFPVLKCDLSGGPNHGTLYLNWSDQRNGLTDTDIWLSKSKDQGKTWSKELRVNTDNSKRHQFFTWMDIDQSNGKLYFVFYDRRNHDGNRTDVYLAQSIDGGNTFINQKISDTSFIPSAGVFFGDYIGITAHKDIVRPVWSTMYRGDIKLWTDITSWNGTLSADKIKASNPNLRVKHYPNPADDEIYVSFKLHKSSEVSLHIYSKNGQLINSIFNQKKMGYGKHIVPINLAEMNVKQGNYYIKIDVDGTQKTLRTIVVN
jgi:hypothetical protein